MNSSNVLFAPNGRRITVGLKSSVCEPDQKFYLKQPQIDYAGRLEIFSSLGLDPGVTAEQFQKESERLLSLIQGNSPIANILKAVQLPIVIPKMEISDLGETLESLLKVAKESYQDTFPKRTFNNYRQGTLKGEVSCVTESRCDLLIEKIKKQSTVGIYFPNPLQGFSVDADREQMADLPESFVLSGLDIVFALAMWIDVLARDFYTPGLDLAAFQWRSAASSLGFGAVDGSAFFYDYGFLGDAYGFYSGGLLFLG